MPVTGRPTNYKPEYCEKLLEFFDKPATERIIEKFYYKNGDEKEKEILKACPLPTITGFCRKYKIPHSSFYDWLKVQPKFSDTYKNVMKIQKDIYIENSLLGLYNSQFAIFFGTNCLGMENSKNLNVGNKEGETFKVENTNALTKDECEELIKKHIE